jgi:hypothetical protein
MATTSPSDRQARNFGELFLWWLILAIFAAAALLLPARRTSAQSTAGPLPAATPSDQPPPSPRASAPAEIGGKPNLSGTWALNKEESDDPREIMQQAGGSGGQGGGNGRVHMGGGVGGGGGMGGGGGTGGGGWGGRGGQAGGQGGGGGRRGGQNGAGGAMNDLSQLTIEQTASSAKVTGDSGRVLAIYSAADSSKASSTSPSSASSSSSSESSGSRGSASSSDDSESASAPPVAQWQGAQLVAVTPGRREGSKTTRKYEMSPDGKQLFVTTKMESPRFKNPVTFRLVYDPAPSGG